jgi:hypothetical protein
MTSAHIPGYVPAHKRPPIPLSDEHVGWVKATVPAVVMGHCHRFDSPTMVENPLVRALGVTLPQRVVVYKEVARITDNECVLMVRDVIRTLERKEPIVSLL